MFSNDNLKGNTWFIVFLLLAYPIEHMASAGWIATTLNYLWPLTFGIISFIPIKKYLEHRKIQWFEYPIYLLSLLFAVSQEQMCAIILTFYFIFSAYTIILKRYNYFIFLLFFVSILNFFYIILSPGNSIRIVEEVQKWFIYFEDLSLIDRLLLGFNTTVSLLLNDIPGIFSFGISNQLGVHNNVNLVFLVFSILLVMLMFKKTNSIFYILVSLIPIISIFIFNFQFGHFFIKTVEIGKITTIDEFNNLHVGEFRFYLETIAGIIIVLSILLTFSKIFTNRKQLLLITLILMAGIFSRVMMGFSPTIFASSLRTAIFLYFSLIICSIYLINEWRKENS